MKTIPLKGLWILLLVLASCGKQITPEPGPGGEPGVSLNLSCQGAIVIDAVTGTELYSLSPDYMLVPASMTKVMTMYIVFDHLEKD